MRNRAIQRVEGTIGIEGIEITLISEGTTNDWGENVSDTETKIKAFPIRFAPFSRNVTNRVGFALDVDVLAYVSKQQFDDLGFNTGDFKFVRIEDQKYEIYKIQHYSQKGGSFLYYIIGGKK